MNFSRGTDSVVKAERSSNSFSRWAAPLPLLVTHVPMGPLALKPTQFFFGLVFLPAKFDLPCFAFTRLLTCKCLDSIVAIFDNYVRQCSFSLSLLLSHKSLQRLAELLFLLMTYLR